MRRIVFRQQGCLALTLDGQAERFRDRECREGQRAEIGRGHRISQCIRRRREPRVRRPHETKHLRELPPRLEPGEERAAVDPGIGQQALERLSCPATPEAAEGAAR